MVSTGSSPRGSEPEGPSRRILAHERLMVGARGLATTRFPQVDDRFRHGATCPMGQVPVGQSAPHLRVAIGSVRIAAAQKRRTVGESSDSSRSNRSAR
jgi:hypothetical protein